MKKYFIIGTGIQLAIIVERFARLPEVREAWKSWTTWIMAPLLSIINIIIWPITIICEIINIKNGN